MSVFPEGFTPDLRRLKSYPSMEDSPWRQPYLADLTFGELHRLIDEFVVGQGLKVLDIGCGTGFLSLELAREGHDVTALDMDESMIDIAVKTMKSDPFGSERGRLEYQLADFSSWETGEDQFDLVTVSRVLHHIPRPDRALKKVQSLLRKGGRVVCVELAYDQFDQRAATWLYQVLKGLERSDWYKPDRVLSSDLTAATGKILSEWFDDHERKEKCNRFEEMRKPLRDLFAEEHFSWKPYLYWDVIAHMRIPSGQAELEMARSLGAMEQSMIETEQINPVLFCFVGTRR